ncbi:hypothetical protein IFM89_018348 [Coptis chinensis]|uniref:RNA-binding protein n=1 Tax=Coptis chinensis TaxID=261450 RepID=A0A835LMM4_9MAGN|nr:hypothetical protein IFM89_018348 [Coptis chinensis]
MVANSQLYVTKISNKANKNGLGFNSLSISRNMADGFWNQPQQQQEAQFHSPAGMAKRPRSDYGHDTQNYFPQDGDRVGSQGIKDTQSIGSAYDRYLQSTQSSFGSGEASADFGDGARLGRGVLGGRPGLLPMGEPSLMGAPRSVGSDMLPNGRGVMGFNGQLPADAMGRPEREGLPLPPDATNTLYIEGLPPDSTKREVARIL